MRLLALRRSAMTCQVCSIQIFTLYYLYEMHLLYVIVLFEAHRQSDIRSTSVSGLLSFHLFTLCYQVFTHRGGGGAVKPLNHTLNKFLFQTQFGAKTTQRLFQIFFEKRGIVNQKELFCDK